jgi:hypothetical protein
MNALSGIDSQPLPIAASLINDMKKKPRENFSLAKNPPKDTTPHIVY